eukprot:gene13774-19682_t
MSRGYSVLSVGRNQSGSLPAGTVNTRRSHEYAVQGHEVRNSMGCNYKPSSPMSRGRSVPSVGLHQSGYLPAGPSNSRRSQEYAVQGEAVQNSMGSGMPGTQVVQQHGQQHASHSSGTIAQAATCQQLQQYNSMGRGMPATQAVLPFWQRIYQRCVLTFDYHKERAINQSEGASFYIFEPENPIRYLLVMAALKMVAQGVITNGKGSYFRVGWNLLDFFVSILGLVVLIGNKIFSESRPTWCIILRGFQGLRIIRASIKVAGIRIIISTFSLVLLEMGGALLVGFVVYYIFGVLATHMFSGKLYYCAVDSNVLLQAYYVVPEGEYINKSWCNQNNSVILVDSSYYHSVINVSVPPHLIYTDWTVPKTRFDNTYLSMWTLFQMASTEGWVDVMLSMVDAVGVDEQPIPNHHPSIEIFSVVFIIVGSFIILGLIASVVINKFKQLKRDGSNIFLTDEQQEWLAIQKMLVAAKIKEHDVPPQNKFRRWMYDLTQATWFQWVIMGVIILSIISMCMEYEGASDEYNNGLRVFNTIATAIYVLEVVCKWIALGLRGYFRNRWNVFDFFVAIISVVGITIEYIDVENLGILYLIRATRVIRILSLVPKARGLSMLVQSILWMMPSEINIAAVQTIPRQATPDHTLHPIDCRVMPAGTNMAAVQTIPGQARPDHILPPIDCRVMPAATNMAAIQTIPGQARPDHILPPIDCRVMPAATNMAAVQTIPGQARPDHILPPIDCRVMPAATNMAAVQTIPGQARPDHILPPIDCRVMPAATNMAAVQTIPGQARPDHILPPIDCRVMPAATNMAAVQTIPGQARPDHILPPIDCRVMPAATNMAAVQTIPRQARPDHILPPIDCRVMPAATNMAAVQTIPRQARPDHILPPIDCRVMPAATNMAAIQTIPGQARPDHILPPIDCRVMPAATNMAAVQTIPGQARPDHILPPIDCRVMPAAVNMAAVLLMFMFIYAIAGMNWFGNIQPGVSHLENIDRHANFNDFPTTMLLLFRFITGQNWDYVMRYAMNNYFCIKVLVTNHGIYLDSGDNATLIEHIPGDNLDNQCSLSPALAVIYFCTYMLWVTFMVVQLVIGIVLEEVQANSFLEDLFIREDHVTAFKDCWAVSDPMGSGFIPICKLGTLLKELEPPFGVKDMEHINLETQSMIDATYIPNRNNRVHFIEVLHALASINAGVDMPFEAEMAVSQGLIRRLPEEDLPPPGRTASQYYASITCPTCSLHPPFILCLLFVMLPQYYASITLAAAMRGFLLRTQKGRFSSLKDAIVEEQRAEGEAVRREKARLDGKRVRSMPGSFGLSRAGASPRSINNLIHAESAANGSFHQARENGTPRRCLRPWSQSTQERRPPSERQFFTDSVTTRGSL